MLKKEDFQRAGERLRGIVQPTPLQYSATFSRYTGHRVWLKPENLQKTGAFKVRGAYNRISGLSDAERERGVITASSGNHAGALAFASSRLGVTVLVVMPEDAPRSKMRAVRGYGAEIVQHGLYADERKQMARELAAERGLVYIDSTDDEGIMEGHGTCALEIIEELPGVDAIVGPIGGGGMMAGVSRAAKCMRPEISVVGVEPIGSCCMYESVRAGEPVEVDVDTIADGLRTRRPGTAPFTYIRDHVDTFHQVSEALITDSVLLLLERAKLLVEPSGAVSMAGVLDGAVPGEGENVVVILTGGNVDMTTLNGLIEGGLQLDWGSRLRP